MSKQRKAMELALEALQWNWGGEPLPTLEIEAIEALKRALAEPEPARKPLTDEQLRKLARDAEIKLMNDEALALGYLPANIKKFARAIERAIWENDNG